MTIPRLHLAGVFGVVVAVSGFLLPVSSSLYIANASLRSSRLRHIAHRLLWL
jgi:hypothetical protein